MHRDHRLPGALIALLVGFGSAFLMIGGAAAEDQPDPPAELSRVMTWLTGEFDNWQQTAQATEENPESQLVRLHSSVIPIEVPALGDHLLYVEEYENGDPENIVRQRIYSLRVDPERGSVMMDIYSFVDPADARQAHLDPMTLGTLDEGRLARFEGCEIEWRPLGDALVGSQPAGGCTVTTASGMNMVFHKDLRLEQDLLVSRERATTDDGQSLWGGAQGEDVQLRRCRFFRGWVGVRDTDGGVYFLDDLELHDQGGMVEVTDADGEPTNRKLRLETTAAGEAVPPALQLSILDDTDRTPTITAAARSDQNARTIGLDSGELLIWFSAVDWSSPDLELLWRWMSGSFSSAAHTEVEPEFFNVSLYMVPIWTSRTDGRWLYVEQAMSEHLDQPYRQRVYRLSEPSAGLFESQVFTLPDPTAVIGAWRLDTPLSELGPENLTERRGCAIYLRRRGDTFEGSTLGSLCTSSLRGASYATSEVVITADGLVSWDRGFTTDGTQAWGATAGGYIFDRLVPGSPEGEATAASDAASEAESEAENDAASQQGGGARLDPEE